jgi:hypothetical protein
MPRAKPMIAGDNVRTFHGPTANGTKHDRKKTLPRSCRNGSSVSAISSIRLIIFSVLFLYVFSGLFVTFGSTPGTLAGTDLPNKSNSNSEMTTRSSARLLPVVLFDGPEGE